MSRLNCSGANHVTVDLLLAIGLLEELNHCSAAILKSTIERGGAVLMWCQKNWQEWRCRRRKRRLKKHKKSKYRACNSFWELQPYGLSYSATKNADAIISDTNVSNTKPNDYYVSSMSKCLHEKSENSRNLQRLCQRLLPAKASRQ